MYIESINENKVPFEEEALSLTERYNEYVMTSLRTIWGCDLERIKAFGADYEFHFKKNASAFVDKGFLTEADNVYTLTRDGKLLADFISAELFY